MPSAEYNSLPVPEVDFNIKYKLYSVTSGIKRIDSTGTVSGKGKLFVNKVAEQMKYDSNSVNVGRDSYLFLIPPEIIVPNGANYDFTLVIDGKYYDYVRIHKAFSHYTIECMVQI